MAIFNRTYPSEKGVHITIPNIRRQLFGPLLGRVGVWRKMCLSAHFSRFPTAEAFRSFFHFVVQQSSKVSWFTSLCLDNSISLLNYLTAQGGFVYESAYWWLVIKKKCFQSHYEKYNWDFSSKNTSHTLIATFASPLPLKVREWINQKSDSQYTTNVFL